MSTPPWTYKRPSSPAILPLYEGDCELILATLPEDTFDAVVTDPPYGLNFMGRAWDHGVPSAAVWKQVIRVMKPGAHLISFAGTRTYHRMAVAVEDAGFEVRDMVAWMYGQGFPKSLNISKALQSGGGPEAIRRMQMGEAYTASGRGRVNYDHGGGSTMNGATGEFQPTSIAARQWDGWGTALKPALEPCVLARKPCSEPTVAANVLRWGTGALNIDSSRVPNQDAGKQDRSGEASVADRGEGATSFAPRGGPRGGSAQGRWPANVIHDGSDEVLAAFPDAPGQQGDLINHAEDRESPNGIYGRFSAARDAIKRQETDKSAARFFYQAKATKADRCGSKHPTVKPVTLIRYLCKLITPPGGRILDSFGGSGTTYEAAILEGFVPTLIEKEPEFAVDIRRRIQSLQAPNVTRP